MDKNITLDSVFAYAFMNKTSGGLRIEEDFIFSINRQGKLSGNEPRRTTRIETPSDNFASSILQM